MIDADLVLIHGFWSSPQTWNPLTDGLVEDPDLAELRIHRFGYESPKLPRWPSSSARIPDYADIAQSLPAYLRANAPGQAPIVFVTHSQGGLILQRFLAWTLSEGRGRDLTRVRAIVMLACPNEGSEYLASIRAVIGLDRHPQAAQLKVLVSESGEARRIVLRQIVHATVVDDRQCPIPVFVYSGRTDNVVRRQSAQSAFPFAEVLPGDHSTILDPGAPGSLTLATLKRHIRDAVNTPSAPSPHATSTATQIPAPPATPAGLETARRAPSADEAVDALFSVDPVVFVPAAKAVTAHAKAAMPLVLARLKETKATSRTLVREYLSSVAAESAPQLLDWVLNDRRNAGDAYRAADCVTAAHAPFCAATIGSHLDHDHDPDSVGTCIHALGCMAANDWGPALTEKFLQVTAHKARRDIDLYNKYEGWLLPARARMLVSLDRPEDSSAMAAAFADLAAMLDAAEPLGIYGPTVGTVHEILAGCRPSHAGHLMDTWLAHRSVAVRSAALATLGQMRLARAVPVMLAQLDADDNGALKGDAAQAVGAVGGPDAFDSLWRRLRRTDDSQLAAKLRFALMLCIADAGEADLFADAAHNLLASTTSLRFLVHRAIGLRGDSRLRAIVVDGLADRDTLVRAHSALALGRLDGRSSRDTLIRAHREASTPMEKVFTSLGILTTGDPSPDDPEFEGLRQDLTVDSHRYLGLLKADVLGVLSGSDSPSAKAIASAWNTVYQADPVYV